MQLYLVRHAQSVNNANVDNPTLRVADPPLTNLGQQQAQHLADFFKTQTEVDRASDTMAWRYGGYEHMRFFFSHIVSSPMLRSLQTAQVLARELQLPAAVWVELHERGGLFTSNRGTVNGEPGLSRRRMLDEFAEFQLPREVNEAGWWRGNMESRGTSRLRATHTAQRLRDMARREWQEQSILLVSHAGFMDMLVKALLIDLHPEADDTHFYLFYNTSVTRIDFLQGGQMGFRYMNRVAHLPLTLIS